MLKITQAMVFAAGKGERLRPFTYTTPKPLLKVQGKALLDMSLDRLQKYGVEKCVVNTHYLSDQIRDHLASRLSPKITLSYEEDLLYTGGGLLKMLPFFDDGPLWAMNADSWWANPHEDVLEKMAEAWRDEDMDCLLLQTPKDHAIGFQGVDYFLSDNGRLVYKAHTSKADHIVSGIQLVHPRAFEGIQQTKFSMKAIWDRAEAKGRLYGMAHAGHWADMSTMDVLQEVEEFLK